MLKKIFALITVSLICASCAPRGESKTIEEILKSSQDRYAAVERTGLPADVETALGNLDTSMTELLAAESGQVSASTLSSTAAALSGLMGHAGYTSRPGMEEIILQYRALANGSAQGVSSEQVALLVSRTYSLLAGELETTRFGMA